MTRHNSVEVTAENFFDRHSIAKPSRKSFGWKTQFYNPVFYALRLTVKHNQLGRPTIPALNRNRHPAAIFRSVVGIVVNAIQGMPGWPFSHVSIEIAERMPALTHGNSTSSVIFPRLSQRICAAGKHRSPDTVNRRGAQSVRSSWALSWNAPAVALDAVPQGSIEIMPINLADSSTSALAAPNTRMDSLDNGPKTIDLTRDIFESSHGSPYSWTVIRGPADVSASPGLAIVAKEAA